MSGDVGALGVATALLLVAAAVGLSLAQRLGLERSLLWAAGRALGQLLLVGSALALVLDDDTPLVWSWVWVGGMVAVAGFTVRRRAPEVPGVGRLAVAAFAASGAATVGVLFGLGIFPLAGRALVPLTGMMVGNSMNATVLVARRLVDETRVRRHEVEARLALALPGSAAIAPVVRSSLRTALTPQLESTAAVGLVALPGAMTGLILAGVDPVDAVLVQVVVMYMILGSVAITTSVVALGIRRRLVSADHRLLLP